MLRSMEMFALQAARRLPREDMAEPSVTNNISEWDLIMLSEKGTVGTLALNQSC